MLSVDIDLTGRAHFPERMFVRQHQWGAHAPSRVVLDALAEDGVETRTVMGPPET